MRSSINMLSFIGRWCCQEKPLAEDMELEERYTETFEKMIPESSYTRHASLESLYTYLPVTGPFEVVASRVELKYPEYGSSLSLHVPSVNLATPRVDSSFL